MRLVLYRRLGERVFIDGGETVVTLTDIWSRNRWASIAVESNGSGKSTVVLSPGHSKCNDVRIGSVVYGVSHIDRHGARLTFEAPREIIIDREEIHCLKHETRWSLTDGQGVEGQRGEGRAGSGRGTGATVRS